MSTQPLSHLTVLDFTHHIAGPYCTKLLAGFGATVIKVERPHTGDAIRQRGPWLKNVSERRSVLFEWLNTSKKSITLDIKSPAAQGIVARLLNHAGVVVENFAPSTMPSVGFSYEVLRTMRPGLIMTSISNFGQTGPYRDFKADEIVEYALSGAMHLTGDAAREPLSPGPSITQYTAGMCAYIATLMSVFRGAATPEGDHIDISIHECALDNVEVSLAEFLHLGKVGRRNANEHTLVPWRLYPCHDGYAAVIGGPIRNWLSAAGMFEEPRILDQKYEHVAGRMEHREEFNELIQPWLRRTGKKDVYATGQARRLAFGYLASLADVAESPQHQAREFFGDVNCGSAGPVKMCGPPFRLSDSFFEQNRAPLLGEHNDEIYKGLLGFQAKELEAMRNEGVI